MRDSSQGFLRGSSQGIILKSGLNKIFHFFLKKKKKRTGAVWDTFIGHWYGFSKYLRAEMAQGRIKVSYLMAAGLRILQQTHWCGQTHAEDPSLGSCLCLWSKTSRKLTLTRTGLMSVSLPPFRGTNAFWPPQSSLLSRIFVLIVKFTWPEKKRGQRKILAPLAQVPKRSLPH